jgi:hypothetical protein
VLATAAPAVPLATPTPQVPWTDESAVMHGICFEAALDAAGQLFILRTADAHIRFYDLADESTLCRRPVARNPFDFTNGRILAGLWSAGIGCGMRHEVVAYERDDATRVFRLTLRVVIDGGCNYELVRPFWIGLDGMAGYDVRIVMSNE